MALKIRKNQVMLPSESPYSSHPERVLLIVGHLCLWGSWLYLYTPSLRWISKTFTHTDYQLNACVALLCSCACVYTIARHQKQFEVTYLWDRLKPTLRPFALLGTWMCCGIYIYSENVLNTHIVSATCWGLGTYFLLGLWLRPSVWKNGLPIALLLIATLPFGTHLDQLVGFPLRVMTTKWSDSILQGLGVKLQSSQSLLILENGIAHVDSPCSGIKSLWSGALFFLALTWITRHTLNLFWILKGMLFVGSLLLTNTLRVTLITGLSIVYQQREWAEILHEPLGILGFVGAGGIAYLLLLSSSPKKQEETAIVQRSSNRWYIGAMALLSCSFLVFAYYQHPRVSQHFPKQSNQHVFPAQWKVRPQALTVQEQRLYRRDSRTSVRKVSFRYKGWSGDLLLVRSRSWRMHHPPEICLTSNGFQVKTLQSIRMSGQKSIRFVRLQPHNWTSIYWYQSHKTTTDILAQRIWKSLHKNERDWYMVSILFHQSIRPKDWKRSAFFRLLQHSIQRTFSSSKTALHSTSASRIE